MAKNDFRLDDMDFDKGLDFDFDYTPKRLGQMTGREVVTETVGGLWDGAYDSAKDVSKWKGSLRRALPKGYQVAWDGLDKVSETVDSLYDQAEKSIKPILGQISEKIDSMVPEEYAKLKGITRGIKERFEKPKSYGSSVSLETTMQQSVENLLKETFAKFDESQNTSDEKEDIKDTAKRLTEQKIAKDRHDQSTRFLSSINANLTKMNVYQEKVGVTIARKGLELNMRQYMMLGQIHQTQRTMADMVKNQLEAVRINTSLPEYKKITMSDRYKEDMKNRMVGSFNNKMFGESSMLGATLKNIKGKVSSSISEFTQGFNALESLLGMGEMVGGMAEMSQKTVPNQLGAMVGDTVASWIRNSLMKTKIMPNLMKNKKFMDVGSHLRLVAENPSYALTLLDDTSFWKKLEDSKYWEQADTIRSFLEDAIRVKPEEKALKSNFGIAGGITPAVYTNKTDISINRVIPGLLSRILREVTHTRTNKDPGLVKYNPISGEFQTEKAIQSSVDALMQTEYSRTGYSAKSAGEFITENIGEDKKDSELFGQLMIDLADRKGMLTPKKVYSTDIYKNASSKDKARIEKFAEKLKTDTSEDRDFVSDIEEKLRAVREDSSNFGGMLQLLMDQDLEKELVAGKHASRTEYGTYTTTTDLSKNALYKGLSGQYKSLDNLTGVEKAIRLKEMKAREQAEKNKKTAEALKDGIAGAVIGNIRDKFKGEEITSVSSTQERGLSKAELKAQRAKEREELRKNEEIAKNADIEGKPIDDSDILLKGNFKGFDQKYALDSIRSIPVTQWNYKDINKSPNSKVGPMAQDLYSKFGNVAAPYGKKIDIVSMNGINMAAIKEVADRQDNLEEKLGVKESKDIRPSKKKPNQMGYLHAINENIINMHSTLKNKTLQVTLPKIDFSEVDFTKMKGWAQAGAEKIGDMKDEAVKKASPIIETGNYYIDMIQALAVQGLNDMYSGGVTLKNKGTDKLKDIKDQVKEYWNNNKDAVKEKRDSLWNSTIDLAQTAIQKGKDFISYTLPAEIEKGVNRLKTLKEKLKSKISGPRDIYIVGNTSPVLTANRMRSGMYANAETGEVIYSVDTLLKTDADIIDVGLNNEVVLTRSDKANGLYDQDGNQLYQLSTIAKGLIVAGASKAYNFISQKAREGFQGVKEWWNEPSKVAEMFKGAFGTLKEKFKGVGGIGFVDKRQTVILAQIRDLLAIGKRLSLVEHVYKRDLKDESYLDGAEFYRKLTNKNLFSIDKGSAPGATTGQTPYNANPSADASDDTNSVSTGTGNSETLDKINKAITNTAKSGFKSLKNAASAIKNGTAGSFNVNTNPATAGIVNKSNRYLGNKLTNYWTGRLNAKKNFVGPVKPSALSRFLGSLKKTAEQDNNPEVQDDSVDPRRQPHQMDLMGPMPNKQMPDWLRQTLGQIHGTGGDILNFGGRAIFDNANLTKEILSGIIDPKLRPGKARDWKEKLYNETRLLPLRAAHGFMDTKKFMTDKNHREIQMAIFKAALTSKVDEVKTMFFQGKDAMKSSFENFKENFLDVKDRALTKAKDIGSAIKDRISEERDMLPIRGELAKQYLKEKKDKLIDGVKNFNPTETFNRIKDRYNRPLTEEEQAEKDFETNLRQNDPAEWRRYRYGKAKGQIKNAGRKAKGWVSGKLNRLKTLGKGKWGAVKELGAGALNMAGDLWNKGSGFLKGLMGETVNEVGVNDFGNAMEGSGYVGSEVKGVNDGIKGVNDKDGDGERDGGTTERMRSNQEAAIRRKAEETRKHSEAQKRAASTSMKYKSQENAIDRLIKGTSGLIDSVKTGVMGFLSTGWDVLSSLPGLSSVFKGIGALGKGAWGLAKTVGKGGFNLMARGASALGRIPGAVRVLGTRGAYMAGAAGVAKIGGAAAALGTSMGGVAGGLIGAGGIALKGIGLALASPFLAKAAVVAGAVYGAYKLYKYFTRNSTDDFEKLRLVQYGFKEKHSEQHKILALEKYLLDGKINYGPVSSFNDRAIKMEEVYEIFGIDPEDKEKVISLNRWINDRFRPIFLEHIDALFAVNNKLKLSELSRLEYDDLQKYLDKAQFKKGPYNKETSPFDPEGILPNTSADVEEMVKALRSSKKPKKKDAESNASKVADSATLKANEIQIKKAQEDEAKRAAAAAQQKMFELKNQADKAKGIQNPAKLAIPGEIGEDGGKEPPKPSNASKGIEIPASAGSLKMASGPMASHEEGAQWVVPGKSNIEGLNPEMRKLFYAMAAEYGTLTNKKIPINEGFRTYQDQLALYRKYPGKAARPGFSIHEKGLALDIPSQVANELESLGLLKKYGFTRPIGGEKWHLEPSGIQLNIKKASNDPNWATQQVALSVGRGGGGFGSIDGSRMKGRDIKVATAVFNSGQGTIVSNTPKEGSVENFKSNMPVIDPTKQGTGSMTNSGMVKTGASSTPGGMTGGVTAGNTTPAASATSTGALANARSEGSNPLGEKIVSKYSSSARFSAGGKLSIEETKEKITEAAKTTGIDPNVLKLFAASESSMGQRFDSGLSKADGPFQFIPTTWRQQMKRHGAKYGLQNADVKDPYASGIMAATYMQDNAKHYLSKHTKNPTIVEYYLAHMLGGAGASRFLDLAPDDYPAKTMPVQAANNAAYFFKDPKTMKQPFTTAEVKQQIAKKFMKLGKDFGIDTSSLANSFAPVDNSKPAANNSNFGGNTGGNVTSSEFGKTNSASEAVKASPAPVGGNSSSPVYESPFSNNRMEKKVPEAMRPQNDVLSGVSTAMERQVEVSEELLKSVKNDLVPAMRGMHDILKKMYEEKGGVNSQTPNNEIPNVKDQSSIRTTSAPPLKSVVDRGRRYGT